MFPMETAEDRISQNKKTVSKLCERLTTTQSFDGFDDEEIIATLIGTAGNRSASDTAANLIDTFGSLKGIIEARPEQLRRVDGMNEKSVIMITALVPMIRKYQELSMKNTGDIRNSRDAERYCLSILQGAREENFYAIALNTRYQIIGKRKVSTGSLTEVNAYPRIIVETALNFNAHSILLTHNHPGGTLAPSAEDIASTLQIQRTLHSIGITLLDHIIVAGDNTYSMIQHGDFDYRVRNR